MPSSAMRAPAPADRTAAFPLRGAQSVRRRFPWRILTLVGIGAAAVLGVLAAAGSYGYRDLPEVTEIAEITSAPPSAPSTLKLARLEAELAAVAPRGVYLVVDAVGNRLFVKRGRRVLRQAVCSTGTGGVLEDPATGRRWVFDTPRGVRRVQGKARDPVWKKPDWAFVEEGLPIPKDPRERFDPASLGDYALYLGDGYLIHGTLYQRLLGRSVTHGCVRLGDEDLEAVYSAAGIGTRVYIW